MIKNYIKHFIKTSPLILNLLVGIIFLYLKLVYITSRWKFIIPREVHEENLNPGEGVLFAIWHNRLAFGMYIYKKYNNVYGLASPHSDGQIITNIIKLMNYKVIEGSTNKNSTHAIKQIIENLTKGNKIVITPDGPRGPIYKINSNITRIAYKYNKKIIPVSCFSTKYLELKSWDKMVIPKPFGKIIVIMGAPLKLKGEAQYDNNLLEATLMKLTVKAKNIAEQRSN